MGRSALIATSTRCLARIFLVTRLQLVLLAFVVFLMVAKP